MRDEYAHSLLRIVRTVDDALNNTSVILLFEAGTRRLLFPGDAQIENWSYALKHEDTADLREGLDQVDLYKVGHHGSRNATPEESRRHVGEERARCRVCDVDYARRARKSCVRDGGASNEPDRCARDSWRSLSDRHLAGRAAVRRSHSVYQYNQAVRRFGRAGLTRPITCTAGWADRRSRAPVRSRIGKQTTGNGQVQSVPSAAARADCHVDVLSRGSQSGHRPLAVERDGDVQPARVAEGGTSRECCG